MQRTQALHSVEACSRETWGADVTYNRYLQRRNLRPTPAVQGALRRQTSEGTLKNGKRNQ